MIPRFLWSGILVNISVDPKRHRPPMGRLMRLQAAGGQEWRGFSFKWELPE